MTIRPRRPTDLDALAAMLERTHRADGYPARWPRDPRAWIGAPPGHGAWVAVDEGETGREPIGHVALHRVAPDELWAPWREHVAGDARVVAVLSRLFVDPRQRHRGVASALMAHAEAFAADNGLSLVLEVAAGSEPTSFYAGRGWRAVGAATLAPRDGHGGLDVELFVAPAGSERPRAAPSQR